VYAKRANRQYTITEGEKDTYIALGYDIYDGKGKLIAHGVGKTVSYTKYENALREIEKLTTANEKLQKELEKLQKEPEKDKKG
jgi:hypothetical protein